MTKNPQSPKQRTEMLQVRGTLWRGRGRQADLPARAGALIKLQGAVLVINAVDVDEELTGFHLNFPLLL